MCNMIYREQLKIPKITLIQDDFKNRFDDIKAIPDVVVVTDPPFNINYHYKQYNDNLAEAEYYEMLVNILDSFPSVIIHYPEQLHRISIEARKAPERVVSWVYNSNTAKQHRDIGFYDIRPIMTNALQPYKNPNDRRIRQRIANGILGGRMYDWWNVNQVKNVNKDKTIHPCQMPLEVMKNIVSTLPENSIVFDPFMGSGTTAIACIDLGYDFIGCEIDNDYYNASKDRILTNANKCHLVEQ